MLPLAAPLLQTSLRDRPPDRQGKVRDRYDFGDDVLIVATDGISAFDDILGSDIPDKGKVLTQISAFWSDRTRSIVPNHLVSTDPTAFPAPAPAAADWLRGRSMLVRRTDPLPIECVAPGYLSGSGWKPSFDKQPPVPSLPDDVVAKTRETDVEPFQRLIGRELQ